MRVKEFLILNEAKPTTMTSKQINTGGGGKYRTVIINGIKNDQEFNWYIGGKEVSGYVKNKERVSSELSKSDDPGKIQVVVITPDGEELTTLSSMIKDELSKGVLQINMGNIAEAIVGCGMAAKFAKGGNTITPNDIIEIGKIVMSQGEYSTTTPARDKLDFKITIPKADTKAFSAFVNKGDKGLKALDITEDKIQIFNQHINDAVEFINKSPRTKAAYDKAAADPRENRVEVLSDGGNSEKQKTTKVDLEILYDGSKINLISLKAGSVKQFGQESGAEFNTLERFFKSVIGFGLPNQMSSEFKKPNQEGYKDYNYTVMFPKAYNHIYGSLKSQVAGNDDYAEYDLVKQIYTGIKYHATRNEPGVVLVVLSPSKKKAFTELGFGEELLNVLKNYDLDVNYKSDVSNPTIEVYGVAKTKDALSVDKNSKPLLVQLRSYKQANAVRNVIEMGPLLKDLADLEKQDKQTSTKSKPKAQVAPQQTQTQVAKPTAVKSTTPAGQLNKQRTLKTSQIPMGASEPAQNKDDTLQQTG